MTKSVAHAGVRHDNCFCTLNSKQPTYVFHVLQLSCNRCDTSSAQPDHLNPLHSLRVLWVVNAYGGNSSDVSCWNNVFQQRVTWACRWLLVRVLSWRSQQSLSK